MAESLRNNRISFLDTAGNVFLDRPEALLCVIGRRLTEARTVLRRRTAIPSWVRRKQSGIVGRRKKAQ